MIKDPNRLVEGVVSFIGGANSSVDPALLPENQYAWGINVSIRGGYPRTRPGFKFIKAIPNGVVQGACYFKTNSDQELMTMIDGRLYTTQVLEKDAPVLDVTPIGETNNYISRRVSMTQANNYLVVQDGKSNPMVYTGSKSFRSNNVLQEYEEFLEKSVSIGANNPRCRVTSTSGLYPGMAILAARGLQPNSVIVSVDNSTDFTLNKNATLTGIATAKFFSPGDLKMDVSIPIGTISAFGNGRLWVANGNELYAGDLAGSYTGSEIRFSETQYLSGGGSFAFNSEITALAFLPGSETSTGQGDLIVFTRDEVHAIRSYIYDRSAWQSTAGMQRRLFQGGGSESFDSVIIANNDIYFRSLDGIRSLLQNIQQTQQRNVSLADSLEANRVILYDTEKWVKYSPAAYFDNRILHGCAPKIQKINGSDTSYNIVFTKIISQDFNPGVYQGNYPPVYDGEWVGLQICKLVSGIFNGMKKCYAIVCGSDGNNAIYEITLDDYFDTVPGENDTTTALPIYSEVEFRRMSLTTPFEIKEMLRADISFSEIFGQVNWSFEFSPDYYPNFLSVQSGTIDYDTESTSISSCSPSDLALGYKTIRSVKPSDSCVTGVGRKARFAYLFQPKMSWTGHAKLALFRLHASRKDVSDLGECQ